MADSTIDAYYDSFIFYDATTIQEIFLEERHFRAYARGKAMEIWKDQPFLGIGPGMFGGVISIIFQSPVYEKYNFSKKWYEFMKPFRSLDLFWPQALAELGIIGTAAFACLLLSLFFVFFKAMRKSQDVEKSLFAGLAVATVFILIYSLGSGLNMTLFLFTYSAITGMTLGRYESPTHK